MAQSMTNDDAIDFIDRHCTLDDLADWITALEEQPNHPLFGKRGVTVEVD
jgi:hypothetical protein